MKSSYEDITVFLGGESVTARIFGTIYFCANYSLRIILEFSGILFAFLSALELAEQ